MRRQHPPIYYKVRTIVRCAFWGSVATAALIGAIELTDDDRPSCVADVHFDFSWSGPTQDLSLCRHPDGIVLEEGGTWRWWDDYIDG